MAKVVKFPEETANVLLESDAGTIRVKDNTDETKYVDLSVTDNEHFLVDGDVTTFYQIVRGNTTGGILLQSASNGSLDGPGNGAGLAVGLTNNNGNIWLYPSSGGLKGVLRIGTGGSTGITIDENRNATFVANLSTDGAATLGDAADDAHTLNGTLQFAQEVTSPSAPGAGAGGIFYVKDDGIPYFVSNTTAETALTGGGSGGGYTVETKSAGFTAVIEYFYIVTSTSGALTVTLPSASAAGSSGKKIGFKFMDAGTHTVTIARNSSDKIDEIAVDLEINTQSSLELISDGSHWFTV